MNIKALRNRGTRRAFHISAPGLPRLHGLHVRLGAIALASTAAVSYLASAATEPSTEEAFGRAAWILAAAIVALSGILGLRTARVAGRIERELARSGSDRRGWQALRPLVGQSATARCWNELVEVANLQKDLQQAVSLTAGGDSEGEIAALSERALRSLSVGVAITDENSRIVRANAALAALIDVENEAGLKGQQILESLQLEGCPQAAEITARLLGGGHNVTVLVRRGPQLEDGVWRICRSNLVGRQSDVPGSVWLVQDATQQAMAVQSRDEFLAAATHELRTPLANIKAYAEALSAEQDVSFEEQKQFCNIINDETTRLNRLVNDLLAVSQLEAGALVVSRDEVELPRAISEAVENARPQLDQKKHTLRVNVPPQVPPVRGDKDKLIAIIVNLLGNAAKYTPSGGRIELSVEAQEGAVAIKVGDNGFGIAEEEIPKLFDKFFRSHDPRVTDITGNGLGLAFAREVARLHGGDIAVQSVLDEGSQFTLTLPTNEAATVN